MSGTSATRPSIPTANEESVSWKTWMGAATTVSWLPSAEVI